MTGGLAYASFVQATTSFERAFNNIRGMMNVIYRRTTVQRGPVASELTTNLSNIVQLPEGDIVHRLDIMITRLMEIYTRESSSNRVSWHFGEETAGLTRGVDFLPLDYNALSVLLRVGYEVRCLLLHGHADRSLARLGHRTTPFLFHGELNFTITRGTAAQATAGDSTQAAAPGTGDRTQAAAPGTGDSTQAAAPGTGDSTQAAAPGTGDGATGGSIEAGNAHDRVDPMCQLLTMELQTLHERAINEARFPTNSIFANNFVSLYTFELRALIAIITAILFDTMCPDERLNGTFMDAEVLFLLEILGGVHWRRPPPPR